MILVIALTDVDMDDEECRFLEGVAPPSCSLMPNKVDA
jgi:hypothetical protein